MELMAPEKCLGKNQVRAVILGTQVSLMGSDLIAKCLEFDERFHN